MSDIIEYLNTKGIPFTPEGNECVIKCPQCKKDKLYINKNTLLYQCFVCQAEQPDSLYAKGHISQLKEEWGDILPVSTQYEVVSLPKKEPNFTSKIERYKHNLLKSKEGMKYIFSRGFDEEDVERFNFGFVEMEDESWISIPAYENGIPKLIKYRKITDNTELKKYRREFGSKSIMFNQDVLEKYDDLFIVAGEFDCCTMIKHGYENTVCGTGGEGTLSPYMYDKLFLKNSFLLILDADEAGQNAARDVWARRLGTGRCWNVKLPDGEDVNSYFNKYGKKEFDNRLKERYKFRVEGILSLSESLSKLFTRTSGKIYPLPWEIINRKLGGGIEKKQLVTIGGQPGLGKTSMVIQIAYYFATVHKMPVLITCLEMSEEKLATKVVQLHNDLDYLEINPNHAYSYIEDLGDLPIYFAYSPTITPEVYYNTVKEARDRYGCELFIFDNLQLLVRSGEESDIGKVTKMFKNDIAMGLDVIMLMVSQPRKLNSEREPTYDDLKGSSAISADSDIILLGRRERKKDKEGFDAFMPKATIIIDKSRFSSGGRTFLKFVGEKTRFEEYKHEK